MWQTAVIPRCHRAAKLKSCAGEHPVPLAAVSLYVLFPSWLKCVQEQNLPHGESEVFSSGDWLTHCVFKGCGIGKPGMPK